MSGMNSLRKKFFIFFISTFLIFFSIYGNLIIKCDKENISVFQGEKINLRITVVNKLNYAISPGNRFYFSYHIYDLNGKDVSFDNKRFIIPRKIKKFGRTIFKIPIYFNFKKSGNYKIKLDIVKEGVFWGSDKGWEVPIIKLNLKPLFSDEFKKKYLKNYYKTENSLLNKEQYLLRIILKNSEIINNGQLMGFSPGSNYPKIWIRDTATFIGYAKLFYKLSELKKAVELFLKYQKTDGEIADNIDKDGNTDKNTVSTDQESSLLLSAYEMFEDDPDWIKKKILNKKIIDRLEAALGWVWKNKLDKKFGLVLNGFTADWGDVEKSYPDQRAVKLSKLSLPSISVYVQAKYIQAIEKFIIMSKYLKNNDTTLLWSSRLNSLKNRTKKHLFLKDKGYFISHITPSTDEYYKMEKEILAVGGNAEAILAGLMTYSEIKKFIKILDKRLKKYKLKSVSFTLLPPYPESFFPHPLLSKQWSYQNGGSWDWIGARLVNALFQKGFRTKALIYLKEIVKKNIKNLNIFEWEDRSGVGRGASFYTGAAGVIGEAIWKGYLKKNDKQER